MECDDIPQDVLSTLPTELEDAKMDVDAPEEEKENDTSKEECAAAAASAVDAIVSAMDQSSKAADENVNGRDETDDAKDKKDDSKLEISKTEPKVQAVDPVDNPSQVEEESKTGVTVVVKDEHELNSLEEFLIPETISDKEYATSEEMLNNCPWELGQLAWARMSIYPFWPCIVTHEPASMQTFRKIQVKGRNKTLMIHVHFFNDHGRHSWIPSHHMIPFDGIENFRKRASLITDAIRRKEPKFAAALTIKPNVFATWQKAVAEAMDVLYELDLTPLESFNVLDRESALTASDEPEAKRKRKSKANDDGKEVKKARKSNAKRDSNTNNNDIEKNLNLDTPPVSPSTMTPSEYRKIYNKKQKNIRKVIDKLQPPDFQVYYERNYDEIIKQYPESTDEHVRMHLTEAWNRMKDVEKLKYRSTYIVPRDADQKDLLL